MTDPWLIAACVALAGATGWMLVRPLLGPAPVDPGDDAVARHRAELAQVEVDLGRGTLAEAEADALRREIGRRLLRAAARPQPVLIAGPPARALALAVLLAVVVGGGGLYLALGDPRAAAPPGPVTEQDDMATLVSRLLSQMVAQPGDATGWMLLGRSLMAMGVADDAAKAFGRAAQARPGDASILSQWGEALVASANGSITAAARTRFRDALAVDPAEPSARYHLALAVEQGGDPARAAVLLRALLADAPPDAPWRGRVMGALARVTGGAAATASPGAAPPDVAPSARGPSQADVAAAAGLDDAERAAMIRGMVEGLAERLKDTPDDVVGWRRLGRSWLVLGEAEKAVAALERADALAPGDPETLEALAQARAQVAAGR